MIERTAPAVLLVGDWPQVEPGYTWIPANEPRIWHLDNISFRLYSLLLFVAYGQDAPLHTLLADFELSPEVVNKALAELVSTRLVQLVAGDGEELAEIHLLAPQ